MKQSPARALVAPLSLLAVALVAALPLDALAQVTPPTTPVAPTPYTPAVTSSAGRFFFWLGGFLLMGAAGWFIFREQIGERRTIRLLVDKIGPFFREFDPANLHRWIDLAAPHIWKSWRTGSLSTLDGFVTESFVADMEARFKVWRQKGLHQKGEFEKVLKVHPLSVHPIGEGPPPADMEVVLRVEIRGDDWVESPDGAVVEGKARRGQVMHFWTLRHDGHRWRLHKLERADRERRELARKVTLPPMMEWKRPADEAAREAAEATTEEG